MLYSLPTLDVARRVTMTTINDIAKLAGVAKYEDF